MRVSPDKADRRILVVDDEPVILKMLEAFLGQHGWKCLTAGDFAEALRILDAEEVSCAIIDLHLKDSSGIDLIKTVARTRPQVRVVAITGSVIGGPGNALAAGAAVVVTKPIYPLKRILNAVEGRSHGVESTD